MFRLRDDKSYTASKITSLIWIGLIICSMFSCSCGEAPVDLQEVEIIKESIINPQINSIRSRRKLLEIYNKNNLYYVPEDRGYVWLPSKDVSYTSFESKHIVVDSHGTMTLEQDWYYSQETYTTPHGRKHVQLVSEMNYKNGESRYFIIDSDGELPINSTEFESIRARWD